MKGMTGYGRACVSSKEIQVEAIVSSYNKKSLEMNVRIPSSLLEFEPVIRKWVAGQFERGVVTVSLRLEIRGSEGDPLLSTVEKRSTTLQRIAHHLSLKVSDSDIFHALVQESDLFSLESNVPDTGSILPLAQEAIEQALVQVQNARLNEGKALLKDLSARIQTLFRIREAIEEKKGDCVAQQVERLQSLLEKYNVRSDETDDRLLKEIVYYTDKLDISEELQRIVLHLENLTACMEEKTAVGKKLDFLLQELMREYNTIGSKTSQADISYDVVLAKTEIEKMREQIQNVE